MIETISPVLVSVAELAALLDEDRGTGIAWNQLRLEATTLDPQIARLGRGLLAVRADADAGGPATAVAGVLRVATGWATLRLEAHPIARILFASGVGGVAVLRLEEFGWFTVELSGGAIEVDWVAIDESDGGVFQVVAGPFAGTGFAWAPGVSASLSSGEWLEDSKAGFVPVESIRRALAEFSGSHP